MQQYMISTQQINDDDITLDSSVWHHIKNVMRYNNNEKIMCVDYQTHIRYLCQIKDNRIKIIEVLDINNEFPYELVLAIGLVKADKLEFIIQKACELGATKLIPIMMERSIVKLDAAKIEKKMQRWNKIALEACEQAKRNTIMIIEKPIKIQELVNFKQGCNFVAYENEGLEISLVNQIPNCQNTMVVIGPEGGISDLEHKILTDNGFISISLGKRILRCETAAVAALSIISYLMEDFNENICID